MALMFHSLHLWMFLVLLHWGSIFYGSYWNLMIYTVNKISIYSVSEIQIQGHACILQGFLWIYKFDFSCDLTCFLSDPQIHSVGLQLYTAYINWNQYLAQEWTTVLQWHCWHANQLFFVLNSKELGVKGHITLPISISKSNLIEKLLCWNALPYGQIATRYCSGQGSTAIMPCANISMINSSKFGYGKMKVHFIWIMKEIVLVKYIPAPIWCLVDMLNIDISLLNHLP